MQISRKRLSECKGITLVHGFDSKKYSGLFRLVLIAISVGDIGHSRLVKLGIKEQLVF